MYVRVDSIGKAGLTAGQMLAATEMALAELGLAQGLVLVHGPRRGYQRYVEAGGHIRFTSYGEPFVPVYPARRERRARGG
jgi:hypothetical protein